MHAKDDNVSAFPEGNRMKEERGGQHFSADIKATILMKQLQVYS